MKNILVSACLLGEPTRYDGRSVPCDAVIALKEKYNLIPVCPEVLGGLPTPRTPSERVGERVLMRDGRDVSDSFLSGAVAAYEQYIANGCELAILKAKSPSCGRGRIYDGSFRGVLTDGDGVFAEYLVARGVRVITELQIEEIDELR